MEQLMNQLMEKMLLKMKEEFEKQTNTITKNVTDSVVGTIDEKLKPLLQENQELKKQVNTLKSKIKQLERDARKSNIIVHGVKESENSNSELVALVLDILNTTNTNSSESWDKWEISSARRLGEKREQKPRPILITVTLEWRKFELWKNKRLLPENIYITEDFPKDVMDKRKELRIQQQEQIKNGKQAFIRYDKLIIKEKPVEKRKRSPTDSPKNPPNQTEGRITTPAKMNKTSKLEYARRVRSDSISRGNTQTQ